MWTGGGSVLTTTCDGSITLTVFPFRNQILPSDAFVTAGLKPEVVATRRIPSAASNIVGRITRLESAAQASISVRRGQRCNVPVLDPAETTFRCGPKRAVPIALKGQHTAGATSVVN